MSLIFVLSLLWKISMVYPQHILVRNEMTRMTNAFLDCRREGGSLISYNQLSNSSEVIKRHCNISDEYFWIGDYSTLTPFLYLEGCFQYQHMPTKSSTIKDNSVARCSARCINYIGIALMHDICQCVRSTSDLENIRRVDVMQCDIHRNNELLGGKNSSMNVYIRAKVHDLRDQVEAHITSNNVLVLACISIEEDFSTDGIHPYCFTGKCDGGRYFTFMPCSEMNPAKVICNNYDITSVHVQQDTKSSWWEAMTECMSNHSSYPLTPDQFKEDITSICEDNDNSLIWTNQRQYHSHILIPDVGLDEKFIFSPTIVCQAVNLTNLLIRETKVCNLYPDENHGYLCYFDSEPKSNISGNEATCIVNLEQYSKGTEPATEVSSTAENIGIPELDTAGSSHSTGIIIGTLTAGVILTAAVIGIIVVLRMFRVRRSGKKDAPQGGTDKRKNRCQRSQNGEKYEESGYNRNSKNLYENLKPKEKTKKKYYEDLEKLESMEQGHVYEKYTNCPVDETTLNYTYDNDAAGPDLDDEEYENSTAKTKAY